MHPPILNIRNLRIGFRTESGEVSAVRDVNLHVDRGEILAVVGESGSGKSVTALSILRLLPPQAKYEAGEILFRRDGIDANLLSLPRKSLQEIRGRHIGMIFQEPMSSLNPVIRCGDQISEAIRIHKKLPARAAKELSIEWLAKVQLPQPDAMYERYPHQLSGGQKQRVMIAMAMCCDPALLICDEPTTALDVTVQRNILDLLRELQQDSGMGVIFITHDLGVVGEIADRAVVMYRGEVVETGKTRDVFFHASHPYTRALLACRPIHHRRGERLPMVSDFMEGVEAMKVQPPLPILPAGEIILSVKELSVWFAGKKSLLGRPREWTKAVDRVSFDVRQGETLGLVGESGCGKTTLGRALLRLVDPQEGSIEYKGRDLTKISQAQLHSLRREMQIVFQDPYSSLNPRISIGEAIAEPMEVHAIEPNAERRKKIVKDLLKKVDLNAGHTRRYPHEFSGGQRQRIVIARALSVNPSFIVCDESVSALDVSVQAQVLNLLNDLKREYGFTIIFISHDLSVVRYFSDRILVMKAGKIVESGAADEIYEHPRDPYTKNLVASIPRGVQA